MIRLTKERVEQILLDFYKDRSTHKAKREALLCNSIASGVNGSPGLGDSLVMTAFSQKIGVENSVLDELRANGYCSVRGTEWAEVKDNEIAQYNWGGGHLIQRLQRALGEQVSVLPKPVLKVKGQTIKGKVYVHLTTDTDWKHKIPHSLSNEVQAEVDRFFRESELEPVYHNTELNLTQLILAISECEYFLGINSGPMHIAAALGIKSIIIINSPDNSIMLPKIRECDIAESEWLYPQNTHLNTAGQNELVPAFTKETLKLAFKGEVYPYWSSEFLPIYFENNFDFRLG